MTRVTRRSLIRRGAAGAMLACWALAARSAAVRSPVVSRMDAMSDAPASGSGAGSLVTRRNTQFLTTADGRRLCFAEWGQPQGFPILTLHGSPGSRFVGPRADGLMRELGIRLITYDRPGYGHSTRRGPKTRVVDHVEDVRALADRLRIASFAIAGGSAGAPPALAVAARLRDRVVRVANWGALAPFDALGLDEYQRYQSRETREYLAAVRESEAACTALFARLDAQDRADLAPNDPRREVVLEPNRQGVAGWVDDERALQAPWGFDVADVRVPTLIHANPQDTLTPPNFAAWLVARIDNAVLVMSKYALGHAALQDRPRAIRAYFTWLAQGGSPAMP